MSTFRNTEYLVLVDANGEFQSGQVKRVQLAPDGTPFPAPPLDFEQAELGDLFDGFNAVILRENTALKAQVANLTTAHAATVDSMQSQINSLQTQLAAAQSQAATNAAEASQVPALQTQVSNLQAANATLESRVAALIGQLPFDPRQITVPAFMDRLTKDELLMLTDPDPTTQQIAGMLRQWKAEGWPIYLDQDKSPEFAMAMGYFLQTGRLTPERVAQITVDASRSESPAREV